MRHGVMKFHRQAKWEPRHHKKILWYYCVFESDPEEGGCCIFSAFFSRWVRGWRSADGIRSDRGLSGAKIVKETRNNFLLPAAT